MTVNLSFLRLEQVTGDAYSFYFDHTHVNFDFLPGQYLQVKLEMNDTNDRGDSRYFTIASSPTEKKYLMVTARVLQSAFKKKLLSLKPDDMVEISGPFGNFVFDKHDTRTKIFLAGGIGVTPFRSMVLYAKDINYTFPIFLFASFGVFADATFFQTFKGIEETLPNFKFVPTITDRDSDEKWFGESGRIDAKMIERYVSNITDSVYYIVGPQDMVASMVKSVLEMGVLRENIKFETFTGY